MMNLSKSAHEALHLLAVKFNKDKVVTSYKTHWVGSKDGNLICLICDHILAIDPFNAEYDITYIERKCEHGLKHLKEHGLLHFL